jgi:two-component system, sensor histidine kinase
VGVPQARAAADVAPAYAMVSDASILLVDDDKAIREASIHILEKWGYDVVAAESTEEALELLRSTGLRPDVLLVDFRLREGCTGVQAIRAIREHCGHLVPAAIITGDTDPKRLDEARAAGFPLLHKPLAAAKLRALLSNLSNATQA